MSKRGYLRDMQLAFGRPDRRHGWNPHVELLPGEQFFHLDPFVEASTFRADELIRVYDPEKERILRWE
jgi:hypothetical protein